jgi:FAD/FMN-containing dehydrogenase
LSGSGIPRALLAEFASVVGDAHVLTGDATAGYAVDWTGRFRGQTPAVLRPADTGQVAAVLALCRDAGVAVVPQGGNTGLVGGGVPRHGEVVLSLARLGRLEPVDIDAAQVTAGAGVSLQRVADAGPGLDLGVLIASRDSATVGGAIAANAGGLRVLRYGPMRAQVRGVEAVLSDGTVVSHLAGLVKDNTGYDYPGLLAGSEGTLAVVTAARIQLVPRAADPVTVIIGLDGPGEVHALAREALRSVPGLLSAEFFTRAGLDVLAGHAGLAPPLRDPAPAFLLLEAAGPGADEDLAGVAGDHAGGPGQAVGLPGAPSRGGRVPWGAAEARRVGTGRAMGQAGHRGRRGGPGGGPGCGGDHLRARRGREPARQRGARGRGGRAARGRGVGLRGLAGRVDLGRARHRRAEGPLAAAGPVRGRARAVRPDQVGVRSGRDTQSARTPSMANRAVSRSFTLR